MAYQDPKQPDDTTGNPPAPMLQRAIPNAAGTADPASREGAAISGASLKLPQAAPAPGLGVNGGWGGDGFSSMDFGTGTPNANSGSTPETFANAAPARAALVRNPPAATSPAPAPTTVASNPAAAAPSPMLSRPIPWVTGAPGEKMPMPPAPAAPNGVTLADGRQLPFGRMINGVATFSDGSGGAGAPPRTITDDQIKQLGNQLNTAPTTAFTRPLASDALGSTPSSEQMIGQNLATLRRNQPFTGSVPSAQDYATADLIDMANGDPRSALGTAARNLRVDMDSGSPGQRAAARQQLGNLTSSVLQRGALGQQQEGQQALAGQQENAAMSEEDLRGRYGLQNAALQGQLAYLTRGRTIQQLGDGTLASVDNITGQATPITMPNGQPATGSKPDRNNLFGTEAGMQLFKQLYGQALGVDPITGMIRGDDGKLRPPTQSEMDAASSKAYEQGQRMMSGQYMPSGGSPNLDQFMAAARKANPNASDAQLQAYYKQKYGAK
jgi:hypothetical protein